MVSEHFLEPMPLPKYEFTDTGKALEFIQALVDKKDYCWFRLIHSKVGLAEIPDRWIATVESISGYPASDGAGTTPLEALNNLIKNWMANQNAGGF